MQAAPIVQEPDQPGRAEHEHVVVDDEPIREELLIEEISIDGMCGVY